MSTEATYTARVLLIYALKPYLATSKEARSALQEAARNRRTKSGRLAAEILKSTK